MEVTVPQRLVNDFNTLAEPWRSGTKEFMAYIIGKKEKEKLLATALWVPRQESTGTAVWQRDEV